MQVSQTYMKIWSNVQFISNSSIDAKGCDGCIEFLHIDHYPQVKGFIIGYANDLKFLDAGSNM